MTFRRGEVGNVLQQRGVTSGSNLGIAKLPSVPRFDLATELLRHGLHAIANAQHRDAQFKHRIGCPVVHFVHTGVAARQDDALEVAVFGVCVHPVVADITGMDFAIHMGLAYAASNQLSNLRAEIKNQYFGMSHE